jgi:mono/diheme cytochrome c family protein
MQERTSKRARVAAQCGWRGLAAGLSWLTFGCAAASDLAAVSGSAQALAGRAAPSTQAEATFGAVLAIFSAEHCATCHTLSSPANNGGLWFNPADAAGTYAALVDAAAASSACADRRYVMKGSPELSLLYDKLANPTPACGARMPLGGELAPAQLETIRAWIALGAPND